MTIWVWLGAFIVLAVIEGLTYSLVSVWFCIGSLAAIAAAGVGFPEWAQIIIFVLVSGMTMLTLRPYFLKAVTPRVTKTNLDRLEGTVAVVTKRVDKFEGVAKADGKEWSARTQDDSVLEVGEQAYILRIEGVRLILESVLNSNRNPNREVN